MGWTLVPTDTCNHHKELIDPRKDKFIQIDKDVRHASWTYPMEQVVIGDSKCVLQKLIEQIKETNVFLSETIKRKIETYNN